MKRFCSVFFVLWFGLLIQSAPTALAQDQIPPNPVVLLRVGQDQAKALKIHDHIFQAIGFGNTFMVTTSEGNVIIDTSLPFNSALHKRLLTAENAGPIKYIILTHGHGDHTGGVPAWKQPGTQIIAQKNHVEFEHYMTRLNGFYALRNAAQFALAIPKPNAWPGNYGAKIEPTILFDDKYEFELGGVKFVVMATPGETYDHATVWIPQYKTAFVGDNYYDSFPNIYTLRGTQPRWALDYVNSLNKVLDLKPEIVLPSHGLPIVGNAEIVKRLTRYRDAIQYVHDETVKGMNAGKDVWTLMNEIKLPAALDIGESYGKLSWSVRGIYEGYVGWFDLNPATMYEKPPSSVYPDLVKLAGGAEAVAKLAMERAQAGKAVDALHLSDIALTIEATNKIALEAKLKALESLRDHCGNSNERGWLDFSINQVKLKLGEKK
ncbi:MAG: MBL fold metallo-hydrolase [Acidobacteria bacterium]|nr:MBL fold metallo-hydrolase [Acidobacteriota bacterium]